MNKSLIRKSFSVLFCIVFCLSSTITSFAKEVKIRDIVVDDLTAAESNETEEAVLAESSSAYNLESSPDSGFSSIETEKQISIPTDELNKTTTESITIAEEKEPLNPMSTNTPPVAGLTYLIANPESLLNGNITTDTIIYWLWEDEVQKYTYDPDGDAIDQILTDGINEFIVANVTLNDVIVGFATQITVAGEYQFLYQAVDEHGAASNILQYNIEVEPADGNKRPVCIISASSSNPATGENVTIDWSNSQDPDGDNLLNVKVKVYDSVGNYQYVTTASPYYAGMTDSGILLKFSEAGSYSVWTSLSDDKNAWSNWSIIDLTVTDRITYQFKDVCLTTTDPSSQYPTLLTWCNYEMSLHYKDQKGPVELYKLTTQNTIPSEFKGRTILDRDWEVYGYVMSNKDTPLANAEVKITIPLFGGNHDFNTTVRTNSKGRFYFQCTPNNWYSGWNAYQSPDGGLSGEVTKWARYGNYLNTTWFGASNLYLTCSFVPDRKSFPVVATTGDIQAKVLAHKWVNVKIPDASEPNGYRYIWVEF